ncbi:MAG: type III toxin-antitoxin system ToxN/AbiQ family toxin [Eubacterium sp.]|nr:type III toxin-antitoxin system ToxN/AbiQ family toxin [Eubacterium sp.]
MENLRLYRIDDKYIRYLKGSDSRVQNNKNKRRPYVGVVLIVSNYRYFVPMESPKPNHNNIKTGRHIMKLDEGRLGLLGFNNMIPVHDSALISFDIDQEENRQYAELLRRQISYINRRKVDIFDKASKTYFGATRGNNEFLSKVCCDFKKLERACNRYNPNFRRTAN